MCDEKTERKSNVITPVTLKKDNPMVENHCEQCYEPLIFAMKDKEHEFSLGLLSVLECLKIAEKEGFVPKLSPAWWQNINSRYRIE